MRQCPICVSYIYHYLLLCRNHNYHEVFLQRIDIPLQVYSILPWDDHMYDLRSLCYNINVHSGYSHTNDIILIKLKVSSHDLFAFTHSMPFQAIFLSLQFKPG